MRLDKEDRKALYDAAAKGKAAEITWPPDAMVEPTVGNRYTIQSSEKAGENWMMVEKRIEEGENEWKVIVKITDPLNLSRGKSKRPIPKEQLGGPQFRDEPEPEKVPRPYQRLLSEEGQLKTEQAGTLQRARAKGLAEEQRAAEARRRGRRGTIRYIERVEQHRKESA